jgi:apolipoprotein N-acyltransferase
VLLASSVSVLLLGIVRKKVYKEGIIVLLLPLVLLFVFSFNFKEFEDGKIKVRLVQPSIKQTLKWNNELLYSNFRSYIDLSKSKTLDGVKLVVWGETATPYPVDFVPRYLNEMKEAIGEDGFLATGVIRYSMENGEYVPYNSLFVIDDGGDIKDYYDKVHLVPFGEYLPFRKYLPDFMKPVANVVGNMGRGEKYKNIKVEGLPLMGGAICYESIFPKEVVNPKVKPEVLLVVANDGWYGESFGPYQHLVSSQMRAVEEGVSVIRSANTGISAVIKPNGQIVGKIGLNEVGISDVMLPSVLSVKTLYGLYGNLILFIMFVLGVVLILILNTRTLNKE